MLRCSSCINKTIHTGIHPLFIFIHQTQHLIVKQIMHGDIYLSEVTITNIYHRPSGQPSVDSDSDMCCIMLFKKTTTEL
jgi:hypothetical protein